MYVGGLDPINENVSVLMNYCCERRGWKEDCEKVEDGCSMYEGGSCLVDPSQEIGKNVLKILMV